MNDGVLRVHKLQKKHEKVAVNITTTLKNWQDRKTLALLALCTCKK
jgi:hypothetical protein